MEKEEVKEEEKEIEEEKTERNPIIDLAIFVIKAFCVVAVLIKFVFMPCVVNGSSMVPTYNDGEYGYSFIVTKNLGIHRFDTAVIKLDTEEEKLLVKRVIGMPGETVEYKDNKLYINGEHLEEDFLTGVTTNDFKVELGQDEYYCLGDNRNISRDSRFYGPFEKKQIVSTHLMIIYPFSSFAYHQ